MFILFKENAHFFKKDSEISGSHGGDYEYDSLMGNSAV
jgi:hypothetical protein